MMRFNSKQLLTAIDIGNASIRAACVTNVNGDLVIKGVAEKPSVGVKRSGIVNLEAASEVIDEVVSELDRQTSSKTKNIHFGISGMSMHGINSHGVVAIKDGEVDQGDLNRVLDAARAVKTPADQKIFHVIPQEYSIDDQKEIRKPLGMSGVRLEASVHLVLGSQTILQNVQKAITRCGITPLSATFTGLASANSVLSAEDKDLGVAVIDIGAGVTTMVCYIGSGVQFTHVVPIGSDHVTADIAVALRVPMNEAERLKRTHGVMLGENASDESLMINGSRINRTVGSKWLNEIIEARYQDIFSSIKAQMIKYDLKDQLAAGIVLTGGGSMLPGCVEMGELICGVPAMIGEPHSDQWGDGLISPRYATLAGILHQSAFSIDASRNMCQHQSSYSGVFSRIKQLFEENF